MFGTVFLSVVSGVAVNLSGVYCFFGVDNPVFMMKDSTSSPASYFHELSRNK